MAEPEHWPRHGRAPPGLIRPFGWEKHHLQGLLSRVRRGYRWKHIAISFLGRKETADTAPQLRERQGQLAKRRTAFMPLCTKAGAEISTRRRESEPLFRVSGCTQAFRDLEFISLQSCLMLAAREILRCPWG